MAGPGRAAKLATYALLVTDVVVIHYPSQRAANWELLRRAARALGVRLITWEPHRVQLSISDSSVEARYDGRAVNPEILLHRTVSPFQGLITPAIRHWSTAGTVVLNDIEASFRARDKLLTTLALRDASVPVVPTIAIDEPDEETLADIDQGDLVLKPAHGVRGEGIEAFANAKAMAYAWGLYGTRSRRRASPGYHIVREHYLAQPLVNGGGTDLRAFVVDGSCVALMRRRARPGEFRANLELGASAEPLPLHHPATVTAVAALRACGLDYGGVDLIEDEQGTIRVLEVDAWAGFAGITAATGVDVAQTILSLALHRASGAHR